MTSGNWRVTISPNGRWPHLSISIYPELETKLRARARAEGLSVEACLERLLRAEQSAGDELTTLALAGVHSGDPIEVGPGYREAKHQELELELELELDDRLRGTGGQ